jgi:hypothetical protein
MRGKQRGKSRLIAMRGDDVNGLDFKRTSRSARLQDEVSGRQIHAFLIPHVKIEKEVEYLKMKTVEAEG